MKRFIILAAAAVIARCGDAGAREIEKEIPRAVRPITARATCRFGYWAGYGAPIKGFGPQQ